MGVSVLALSAWLLVTMNWPPWHAKAWAASALSGLLNLLALYLLYKALARGPVAVASPATSTFTVLLIGLNILSGEPWSWMQLFAMLIVFTGVLMLARPTATDSSTTHYDLRWLQGTAALGLAAAMAVSIRMFLAQEANAELGALHALYLNRLFALAGAILLMAYCVFKQTQFSWPVEGLRKLVLLQAVLESAALGAFLIGSAQGGRVAATIGFAAFAAATALLAWAWLGERIGWQRGIWITVISTGILFAMLTSP